MIALLLTAALLADPSSKPDVRTKAPPRATLATVRAAPEPVLAGVAATVECSARADGRVVACQILGETHPGLGFGDAAVALLTGSEVPPAPEPRAFTRTIQFTP